MPRPAHFDGSMYSGWHSAPIPVMTVHDTTGHLLAQLEAPRTNATTSSGRELKTGLGPGAAPLTPGGVAAL